MAKKLWLPLSVRENLTVQKKFGEVLHIKLFCCNCGRPYDFHNRHIQGYPQFFCSETCFLIWRDVKLKSMTEWKIENKRKRLTYA